MSTESIHEYIRAGVRAHLVGIGGVSMAPLGEVLHGMGMRITGSDSRESETVEHLRSIGIPVTIGHLPESVEGAQLVIRTAAVHDSNPEIAAARAAGIPVFERAQAWGSIMRSYRNALCISGTHGKTTTTSMCTHIAMAAEADPTVMIGGTLPLLGSAAMAVILDIEADHLDFFKDLEEIKTSFRTFADRVPEDGTIIANRDDANTMAALAGEERRVLTYGLEEGDVHAANLTWEHGLPRFDVIWQGSTFARVKLNVPGVHNVRNALAAAASAIVLGMPGRAVEEGLTAFRGADRRFEHKGSCSGAQVYDDYAHHPGELAALLDAVGAMGYERIICAFQPHTYSRTKALFDDFVSVLRRPDVTVLTEIYAAREINEIGISSADLAAEIPGAVFCPTLEETEQYLRKIARPGDVILTVGAGDIYTVGGKLTGQQA